MDSNRIIAADGVHFIYKIGKNTYRIDESGIVNSYLLIGDTSALLIDTGNGVGNIRKTAEELTDKPIIVGITHRHCDHIGGAGFFEDVYCGTKDRSFVYSILSGRLSRSIILKANKKYIPSISNLRLSRGNFHTRYIYIDEGFSFDLGNRNVKVISTPGHTKGSLIYLDDKEKIMITGDEVNKCTWLQLPGCTKLSVWLSGANRILSLADTYKPYGGHMEGELKKADIKKIIDIANKMLEMPKSEFRKRIIVYPENIRKNDYGFVIKKSRIN